MLTHRYIIVTVVATALFFAISTGCRAEGPGRITTVDGGPPPASIVEQPQDALKIWHDAGIKGMPVVVIGEDLPVYGHDEAATSNILGSMSHGQWDELLAKTYPTARYYPVNRMSYLYLAYRAGIISRIYWVPPTKDPVGTESLDSLKGYMRSIGIPEAELASLKQDTASISGTVNGIPLYVYRLSDLPRIPDPVLLSIDLSFFTPFYKNEVNTPLVDLFGGFINSLGGTGIHASNVTISRSSIDKVPLDYRFLARYIATYITDPQSIADGPLPVWRLRSEAMYYDTFFLPEDALKLYKEAADMAPTDPDIRYNLAISYLANKDIDRMKEALDRAVSIDNAYYPAYYIYGQYMEEKDIDEAASDFYTAAVNSNPSDPRGWEALHAYNLKKHDVKSALAAQEKIVALGFDGPKSLTALADDLSAAGRYGEAIENYNKALTQIPAVDSVNRSTVYKGLADAYERSGKVSLSLDALKSAIDTTADGHARYRLQLKYDALTDKWAPFMGGGKP